MPDLGSDLLLFLNEGKGYDLTLVCDGGEQLKVHENILVARSVVFQSMMDLDMEEKRTGIVEINDFEMEVVVEFVRFLYSDKISENFTEFAELLKIGHKYQVASLVDECSQRLAKKLEVDNVILLGSLAESYQVSYLSDKCAEFMSENLKKIDSEELDKAPATLLRKALRATSLIADDRGTKPPHLELPPLSAINKTQYPANFFKSIANPGVVTENDVTDTVFMVSRKTKLAGIGLYIGQTEGPVPIECRLIERSPARFNPEYNLMTVSTKVSTYPMASWEHVQLMFPFPVKVDSDCEYKLLIKPGINIINLTPVDSAGEYSRVTVPMEKEDLVIKLAEPCCQIPILYFED